MSDLTRVVPFPVAVTAGGARRLVWPLRLRDFASLQAWLKTRVPCPLDAALEEIDSKGLQGRARQRRLAEAFEACEVWPPRQGSDAGDALLGSADGVIYFLTVVADRSKWSEADLLAVVSDLTPDSLASIRRAAYQSDPLDTLTVLMELLPDDEADPAAFNWARAFVQTIDRTGWTFDQVADLTLAQWQALRTGGVPDRTPPHPVGMTYQEAAAAQRRKFWGDDLE
mgnify:CR=1 FL=1